MGIVEVDAVRGTNDTAAANSPFNAALDVALGLGGLPRGRVVEIYGPESSGKTTVALHCVASAQARGGIVALPRSGEAAPHRPSSTPAYR